MKYGESTFDILYLIFAIALGALMLRRRKSAAGRLMGWAALILGCGDAFHLVPRVLNYFIDADFSAWLGVGKLITSVTMTLFYLLMYRLWLRVYGEKEDRRVSAAVYVLTVLRVVLCLLPQNRWLLNDSPLLWAVLRNIPFAALGALIVWIYFRKRAADRRLGGVWLLVTLSFLFYIPVTVGAGALPILGALMLPKTVCYMLLIWTFWKYPAD